MYLKRKHVTLTLKEKYEILKKIKAGVNGKALALKYHVGKSTISDIKRNKAKIEATVLSKTPKITKFFK